MSLAMLRREAWKVNTKRVYRLYREEQLLVPAAKQMKRAPHPRVPLPEATWPNQRWSMDFVSDRLADGGWFRALTVVDQYTRTSDCIIECEDRGSVRTKDGRELPMFLARGPASELLDGPLTNGIPAAFAARYEAEFGVKTRSFRAATPTALGQR